jgi:hypothetical protein
MVDDPIMPTVEVGRIVFRSWEHQWQTDSLYACSVGSARRALPSDITRPIYAILERWERDLLRSSLPFPPYGLRIRPSHRVEIADASDILVEKCCRHLGELCPNWDEALPQPQVKRTGYRELRAPSGDTSLGHAYQMEWQVAVFPEAVRIDELLREFSPRHKEPSLWDSLLSAQAGTRRAPQAPRP